MARVPGVLLGVALLMAAAPLSAQQKPWHDQWFWGAQGGVHRFFTPTDRWDTGYSVGVNWLVTGKRMGLYMSFDQILYNNATSIVNDPTSGTGTRDVVFDNGRYLQADLIAMPLNGPFQFMLGAGFTIHDISDATVQGTFATPEAQAFSQSLVDDASTRAFWNIMTGFTFMIGRRAGIFVQYEFIPSTENHLITSEQHTLMGGLRYSFGGRREVITTEDR